MQYTLYMRQIKAKAATPAAARPAELAVSPVVELAVVLAVVFESAPATVVVVVVVCVGHVGTSPSEWEKNAIMAAWDSMASRSE
mmetsp:Transcript_46510/g.99693  ORF Transcript_46510/g.99693 Transcript_46510/m.99693 type:complete len:84 (+) Transcript_46510:235-486(+)